MSVVEELSRCFYGCTHVVFQSTINGLHRQIQEHHTLNKATWVECLIQLNELQLRIGSSPALANPEADRDSWCTLDYFQVPTV